MNRIMKGLLLVLILVISVQRSQAQDLLKGKDLSQVKVDNLTEADIAKLKAQLTSNGMTLDDAEKLALSRGMPASEFAKLRQRLTKTTPNETPGKLRYDPDTKTSDGKRKEEIGKRDSTDIEDDVYKKSAKPLINPLIFGSELYTSVAPSFEPNQNLATPVNYILGPDDQLELSVYGVQEYNGSIKVTREGSISVPNVGEIRVSGLTIEAATQKIRTAMANSVYPTLRSGGSKMSLTLGQIRTIKVTVIGSNRPGTISISSLSNVFNALYLAGGPTAFGSFRQIELLRNNKVERVVDLYRMLLHGDQSDNIGLKDNDVIRIPPYKKRVEVQGQVKRPGIFEVLPGESFASILEFASGFTDTAYESSVKIFQRSATERKITDISAAQFGTYQPQSGDVFVVSRINNRFENRVRIDGAVFRPDVYALSPDMTVADLIRKADGLKEDAFTGRGQILRLQQDLTRSTVSFDIRKALNNQADQNLLLQREDEVFISSVLDLRDSFKVTIQGEVRLPGKYEYVSNLTLKDLVLQAGGFTDAAYKNIEIARLIKRDSIAVTDNRASVIINAEINGQEDLAVQGNNIKLEAFDVITIRKKAGYIVPETVVVSGQVQYPGPYALSNSSERVSSILNRAGSYTPDAYPEGAYLKRYNLEYEKQNSRDVVKKFQSNNAKDSLTNTDAEQELSKEYDNVPLNLIAIMANPGSVEDLVMRAKDELFIPKFDGQVKVRGATLLVTQVPYQRTNSLIDYVNEAGGFSGNAWRKKAYVVYANGKAAATKHFLFFKFYPKVLPGSTVWVPKKPEKKGASTGEIIGIASALASLAGVVIAILRL